MHVLLGLSVGGFRSFLLCLLIIVFMFGMQLYCNYTITLFLLKILWNLCCLGKCLCNHRIVHKVDVNGMNNCFVTLKDYKDNFQNNPTTRLINPAKNELGRISKVILEKINTQLRTSLNLNQWKSTSNVIEWFNNINEKNKYNFMMFDIKDCYPFINEKVLKKAIILLFLTNFSTLFAKLADSFC